MKGKFSAISKAKFPCSSGWKAKQGYPHEGTINFINNQVNPGTGSITVRGVVPNSKPENGVRLLSPGMFVRVRLPIGKPHDALLVIDRAIGSDQGMKYVYVVDDKNIVQQRRVETGALQDDGLRVIDGGLETARLGGGRRHSAGSAADGNCPRSRADANVGTDKRRHGRAFC